MTQFPQPCGFFRYITCGSILSERRIAELGAIKKHLFRSHSHCASVPVLSVFLSFLGALSNSLCQFRAWSGFSTRLILHRPNGTPVWPLFFVCRPGVLFSGQTSLCADQGVRLPGHTSLGWRVEQRYITTTRNVTSV